MEHGCNSSRTFLLHICGGIAQVISPANFHLQLACGLVALLHLLAERLYLANLPTPVRRFADGAALNQSPGRLLLPAEIEKFAYDTLQSQHSSRTREAARESFALAWVSQIVNLLMIRRLRFLSVGRGQPPDSTDFSYR